MKYTKEQIATGLAFATNRYQDATQLANALPHELRAESDKLLRDAKHWREVADSWESLMPDTDS